MRQIVGFLVLLFLSIHSKAQSVQLSNEQLADSSYLKTVRAYDQAIGKNSFLFTGKVYYDKYGGMEGHQYFIDDYWDIGSINYEGQDFDSIYMMYDILNDVVLIEHFNTQGRLAPITLYNPAIASFVIHNHRIVRLEEDTISNLKTGFYDELFLGDQVTLYAKREKQILKTSSTNSLVEMFIDKDKYYLKKNGSYYLIRSKKTFLNVLHDQKKALRRHFKSLKINFRQYKEYALLEMVKYYDSHSDQ